MNNAEVCGLLQISQRTLQSYRDDGTLPYSQIGRKCYYKTSDVEALLNQAKTNPDERRKIFDLSVLVGNWESVNLHPTVIIYRNGNTYLLSLIHMNETSKQASPATYEIQEDENGYFISYNLKRLSIGYDVRLDMLKLSSLGDYMRN